MFAIIFVLTKQKGMTSKDIKAALLNGQNFGNESAGWYTLCKPSEGRFIIVIADKYVFCKSIGSAARRIFQLINRGY